MLNHGFVRIRYIFGQGFFSVKGLANEAKSELKKGLMEAFLAKSPEELMEIGSALLRFGIDLALFSKSELQTYRKQTYERIEKL